MTRKLGSSLKIGQATPFRAQWPPAGLLGQAQRGGVICFHDGMALPAPARNESQPLEQHDILFVFQQGAMERRDRLGRVF